jgi:hypothetical protein
MSTPVVINGTTYSLPTQGQSPPWGDDLSSLLLTLINVTNSLSGPADITTTSFTIANNVSTPTSITGLSFDTASVRSATITYSLYRGSSTTETSETGQLMITYKSTAGTWELGQFLVGSSGVVFTITNSGQIQFTSSSFTGINYVGKLKFKASAFLQT